MAFFSDIVNETRQGQLRQPVQHAAPKVPAAPGPFPPPVPAAAPVPAPDPVPAPATGRQPEPEPPAIDLTPEARAQDDGAKRRAHEAAEAKRKAEWDAKQSKRKAARQAALDRIAAMNGAELLAAATDRVA